MRKAEVVDNVPAEMFKALDPESAHLLHQLYLQVNFFKRNAQRREDLRKDQPDKPRFQIPAKRCGLHWLMTNSA
jgi:hypothetical protein